jgi:hypothetical protein
MGFSGKMGSTTGKDARAEVDEKIEIITRITPNRDFDGRWLRDTSG